MKFLRFLPLLFSLSCLQPALADTLASRVVEDGGTGQYSALMLTESSLPTHTLFRPAELDALGEEKLPILVWGNGACFDSPWEHVNFLNEIASHGFFVVAIGTMPKESGEQVTERSTSAKLTKAIDWAIAQHNDTKSPYYQRLDPDNIAVSGMSCGGLQALEVAADPRITTLGVFNSGIFNSPRSEPMLGMPNLDKNQLEKVHTPTLYLLGGPSDIAYENGMNDVERLEHVPVFVANMDVGHGGTYGHPHGGEFARVALAWYQWQLKDDPQAAKLFVGNPPGLAESDDWDFAKKNID